MKQLVAAAAVAAALVLAPAAGAFDQTVIPYQPGNPHANGCQSGWEVLSLSDLNPYGYMVPAFVDSPANGGNGDGVVCGKPFSAAEQAARAPDAHVPVLFNFVDNNRAG